MAKKMLKTSARALIEKNKQEDDREKVSLYLSKSLYDRFKKVCEQGGAPASRVLEGMIKEFLDDLDHIS